MITTPNKIKFYVLTTVTRLQVVHHITHSIATTMATNIINDEDSLRQQQQQNHHTVEYVCVNT